jgi:hypothetical protein
MSKDGIDIDYLSQKSSCDEDSPLTYTEGARKAIKIWIYSLSMKSVPRSGGAGRPGGV